MKTRRIMILLLLSVTSISLLIFSWLELNLAYHNDQISTLIIGSTDGPTSILVVDTSHNYLLYGSTLIIAGITLVVSAVYGRKRK